MRVDRFATEVRARLFEFGVVAFRFTFVPPDVSPEGLIELSARLASGAQAFDTCAQRLWMELKEQARGAVVPWEENAPAELTEDFVVFVLPALPVGENARDALAHILLGEPQDRKLSAALLRDIESRAISYYERDCVFVDYEAAVIVDDESDSDLVDIFEIASAQLLELRFYEATLSRALVSLARDVRRARTAVWLFRSPFRGLARRAATLALEIGEMTDRLEGSITLIGDSYSVYVYRETALRFRLGETKAAVRDKLTLITRIAEGLGHEVQSRRDMLLEIMIVLLIAFEIVMALRG
jgi:hypothetical protein